MARLGRSFPIRPTAKHGTVVAAGATLEGAATLAGTTGATLAGNVVYAGAATLAGSSTASATGQVLANASATLTGTSGQTSAGRVEELGAATLVGTSGVSLNAQVDKAPIVGAATLSGAGALTATGRVEANGSATLAGSSGINATGNEVYAAAATLIGTSGASLTGYKEVRGAATLSGTSTATSAGIVEKRGSATLAGTSGQTSAGRVEKLGAVTLVGTSGVSINGRVERNAVATLVGTSGLTASANLNLAGQATLNGISEAIPTGDIAGLVTGEATLVGVSTLSATGSQIHGAAATLIGSSGAPSAGIVHKLGAARLPSYYSRIFNTPSVVDYWRLNEPVGTTAVDSVGTNDGTYVNTPTLGVTGLITDSPDTAVTFDSAQSEEVTLPGPTPTTDMSVEYWIDDWTGGTTLLRDHTSVNTGAWMLGFNSGGFFAARIAGTVLASSLGVSAVRDGNRHHVVITKAGAAAKIYVDGVEVGTGSVPSTAPTMPWHLGRNGSLTGAANYNDVTFDELAFYSVALSASEVRDHYLDGTGVNTYSAFSGDARIERLASATLSGSSGLVAQSVGQVNGAATCSATSGASATGRREINAATTLGAMTTLVPSAHIELLASVINNGQSSMQGLGSLELDGAATLSGISTLTAQMPGNMVLAPRTTLRGYSGLTANVPKVQTGVAYLRGYSGKQAAGIITQAETRMIGLGTLTANGVVSSTLIRASRRVFAGKSGMRGSRVRGGVR